MSMREPQFPPRRFEQREFFVPGTETDEEAQKQWQAFAAEVAAYPSTDRKVQRLVFTSNRKEYVAEVGYLISDETSRWLVTAIFEPYGTSTYDPWTIFLLRIWKGEVITRKPAWLVPPGTVVEALDFSQPVAHQGNGPEDATPDAGSLAMTSRSNETKPSFSERIDVEIDGGEIDSPAQDEVVRLERRMDREVSQDETAAPFGSSIARSQD